MENSKVPTTQEIEHVLQRLADGEITRQEAAAWADPWVSHFELFYAVDPNSAPTATKAIERIAGADEPAIDRDYLFDEIDFQEWLIELLGQ